MTIRAVLDTNVLVSGLIGGNAPPRQLLDAWLQKRFTLVTSLHQVEEVNHVLSYPHLAQRLGLDEAARDLILAALLAEAEVTAGSLQLPGAPRDPKDDPILACAVEGHADYLVSGDRELLDLDEYESIRLVSPREFAKLLEL